MEPYDPNKPIIYIDKDKIKQNILETILSLPGARALKNFHDNPEGPATETLALLAEDVVPFYGTYRNGGDWSDYAKEAAIFGIPMPYTKFPKGHAKAGEAIPNNLKEGLGYNGWKDVKSKWKNKKPTARKLYANPDDIRYRGSTEGGLSTVSRVNSTANARTPVDVPAGPYRETNTGSNVVNTTGQQVINNNSISTPTRIINRNFSGSYGWQGEMYPPGRSLARLDEYGPHRWEKATDQTEYIRKLNDIINENENKWEYLINKTRTRLPEGSSPKARLSSTAIVPKEDIVSIALTQGRPDIAARVMADNEARISANPGTPNYNKRFTSYLSQQRPTGIPDNAKWKDVGNRQVEKELREQFAMLPEDDIIRDEFAQWYGVPDLYNDWKVNPEYWKELRDNTAKLRSKREANNRLYRRNTGWENPNQ